VVEQIENVNWLGERAIFKHNQFFDHMGHGFEWRKKHKNSNDDKNQIGYFIKKSHCDLLSLSRLSLMQS
jgi:hypothetical protein